MDNHYEHIEKIGKYFSDFLNLKNGDIAENLSCDGDKAYQYRSIFERHNIKFADGVMIYMLSNEPPFSHTVRDTINGWVSVESWLDEKCQDKTILRALAYANNFERNQHLIMLSDKLNELRDKGDGFLELKEFKNNFPKLKSENFYSQTVYDCAERNSSYIINVKNCDRRGFSLDVNANGQINFSDANDSPYNYFKHDKCVYDELPSMFGGYVYSYVATSGISQLEAFISYKLGIGKKFLSAHLTNISKLNLYDYTSSEDKILLININAETKKVEIFDYLDAFEMIIKQHLKSDKVKFDLIKLLAKG